MSWRLEYAPLKVDLASDKWDYLADAPLKKGDLITIGTNGLNEHWYYWNHKNRDKKWSYIGEREFDKDNVKRFEEGDRVIVIPDFERHFILTTVKYGQQEFEVKGRDEDGKELWLASQFLRYIGEKKCKCDLSMLMTHGCQCGGA